MKCNGSGLRPCDWRGHPAYRACLQEVLANPKHLRRLLDLEKFAIVREALIGVSSVAEVARRHDLTGQQIIQWRSAMRCGELVESNRGRPDPANSSRL